jgi:hypothetical protein
MLQIRIRTDLHYSGIPDLDPYQSEKLDPDPHQSEAPGHHPLESQNTEAVKEGQNGAIEAHPGDANDFLNGAWKAHNGAVEGMCTLVADLQHLGEEPDPVKSEKSDPDPHQL